MGPDPVRCEDARDRTSAGAEFFASSALAQSEARTIPQGSGNCKKIKKKEIAAPEFRVWSPTTLLGQALTSLTTVDRTGNGAFLWIWPQPKE